ncbi:MAG: hypothetical protein WCS52_02185 [bacterium]
MTTKTTRTFDIGLMCEPLVKQLAGLAPATDLMSFDEYSQAISRLCIFGLLTDSQTESARRRLVKKVQKSIKKAQS